MMKARKVRGETKTTAESVDERCGVPDRTGRSPQELHVLHSSRLGTMLAGCTLIRARAGVGSLPEAATDPAGWDRCGALPCAMWARPAPVSESWRTQHYLVRTFTKQCYYRR